LIRTGNVEGADDDDNEKMLDALKDKKVDSGIGRVGNASEKESESRFLMRKGYWM
jgi:hypothetical protein